MHENNEKLKILIKNKNHGACTPDISTPGIKSRVVAVAVVPDDAAPAASVLSTVAIDAPLPAVPADTGVPPVDDPIPSDDAPATHDAPLTEVSFDESVLRRRRRRHALRRQGCRGQRESQGRLNIHVVHLSLISAALWLSIPDA